jgi:hypothetical protein
MNASHITVLAIGKYKIKKSISVKDAAVVLTDFDIKDNDIFEVAEGHATNTLTFPNVEGKVMYVVNKDASLAVKILVKDQETPITIAAGKSAIVYCDGTVLKRLTADA